MSRLVAICMARKHFSLRSIMKYIKISEVIRHYLKFNVTLQITRTMYHITRVMLWCKIFLKKGWLHVGRTLKNYFLLLV